MPVVTCLVSLVVGPWTITTIRQELVTHPDRGARGQRTARPPRVILSPPIRPPLPPLPLHLSPKSTHNISQTAAASTDTSTVDHPVSTISSSFLPDNPEGPCVDSPSVSHQQGPSYNTDPYTSPNIPPIPVTSYSPPVQQANPYTDQYLANPHSAYPQHDQYQNPYTQGADQGLQRAYTLGGSGYGDNVIPENQGGSGHIYNPYVDSYGNQPPTRTTSPPQTYTGGYQPTPVHTQGPTHTSQLSTGAGGRFDDNPPTYDEHEVQPAGVWSSKA
jgi:hypothetical protein